jgi:hypothetical protein
VGDIQLQSKMGGALMESGGSRLDPQPLAGQLVDRLAHTQSVPPAQLRHRCRHIWVKIYRRPHAEERSSAM